MAKLIVKDTEVNILKVNGKDYICLADMLRAKDGDFFITDWLRNRNTLEFIGIWEKVYNPNFNYGEFATIRNQSGLNSFKISVKEFVAQTNAISVQAKAGRYGVYGWTIILESINQRYIDRKMGDFTFAHHRCQRFCLLTVSYGVTNQRC